MLKFDAIKTNGGIGTAGAVLAIVGGIATGAGMILSNIGKLEVKKETVNPTTNETKTE